jgi:hypothetical protein
LINLVANKNYLKDQSVLYHKSSPKLQNRQNFFLIFEDKQILNLMNEKNLMQLNIDKDKYKAEFDKIPESAKTMA